MQNEIRHVGKTFTVTFEGRDYDVDVEVTINIGTWTENHAPGMSEECSEVTVEDFDITGPDDLSQDVIINKYFQALIREQIDAVKFWS